MLSKTSYLQFLLLPLHLISHAKWMQSMTSSSQYCAMIPSGHLMKTNQLVWCCMYPSIHVEVGLGSVLCGQLWIIFSILFVGQLMCIEYQLVSLDPFWEAVNAQLDISAIIIINLRLLLQIFLFLTYCCSCTSLSRSYNYMIWSVSI